MAKNKLIMVSVLDSGKKILGSSCKKGTINYIEHSKVIEFLENKEKTSDYLKQMGFMEPIVVEKNRIVKLNKLKKMINITYELERKTADYEIIYEIIGGYLTYIRDPHRCVVGGAYIFSPRPKYTTKTCLVLDDKVLYFSGRVFDKKAGYFRKTVHFIGPASAINDEIKDIIEKLEDIIGESALITDLKYAVEEIFPNHALYQPHPGQHRLLLSNN